MVDVTEGLNTSPLNNAMGFKSAKLFIAVANLKKNEKRGRGEERGE